MRIFNRGTQGVLRPRLLAVKSRFYQGFWHSTGWVIHILVFPQAKTGKGAGISNQRCLLVPVTVPVLPIRPETMPC